MRACVCVIQHFSSVFIPIGNLPIFYILRDETHFLTFQFTLSSLHTDVFQSHNRTEGKTFFTFSVTCLKAFWVLSCDGLVVTQGSHREKGEGGPNRDSLCTRIRVGFHCWKARVSFTTVAKKQTKTFDQTNLNNWSHFKVLKQKRQHIRQTYMWLKSGVKLGEISQVMVIYRLRALCQVQYMQTIRFELQQVPASKAIFAKYQV